MTYTVNMPSMHPNIFLQQNVIQLATYSYLLMHVLAYIIVMSSCNAMDFGRYKSKICL